MSLKHNVEQKWALGTLAIFGILILFAGLSDFTEIGIAISTFLISWLAVSYSIRRFGKGGTSNEEIQKEMQIFSILLLVVLLLITLVGVNEYSDYASVSYTHLTLPTIYSV